MLSDVYGQALTSAGFAVEIVASAQEVMNALEGSSIDLILLDMILPNESGLEILEKIKKEHADQSVVMFTNLTAPQELAAALDLGAIGLLEKAKLTPRELAIEVERLCKDPQKGIQDNSEEL